MKVIYIKCPLSYYLETFSYESVLNKSLLIMSKNIKLMTIHKMGKVKRYNVLI